MVEYQKIKSEKSDYTLCEIRKDSDWRVTMIEKTKLIGGLITLISVIIVQKRRFSRESNCEDWN